MSKRSFMEIFSGACAEIGRNVSEDLRDLRNQCMAKVNDVCTDASATVAAKVRLDRKLGGETESDARQARGDSCVHGT
jgi:hypothetical protein